MEIRTKRFIKIWALFFGMITGFLVAFMAVSSGIIYGMMVLHSMYGPIVTIPVGIGGLSLVGIGLFSWAIAKEELKIRELKEQETMDILKKSSDSDDSIDKYHKAVAAYSKYKVQTTPKKTKLF